MVNFKFHRTNSPAGGTLKFRQENPLVRNSSLQFIIFLPSRSLNLTSDSKNPMQTLLFPTPYPSQPEQYGARHKAAYREI